MNEKEKATNTAAQGEYLNKDTENSQITKICHDLDEDYLSVTCPEIDPYLIDLTKDYPEPEYLLKIGDVSTMPKGDISSVKAKSKNGKTYLESIFIASFLGYCDMNINTLFSDGTAVYFDTEQNPRNTARIARRIHILLGWSLTTNNKRFKAYSLRSMPTNGRLPYITKIIEQSRPDMVVIDGIADLIDDFNNIEQSSMIIDEIMKLSTTNNCHISCVLHTNKSLTDNNMKGHLGTMLLQKSSDVFEVKKDGKIFNVSETDSRNFPVEDFSFSLNVYGIPEKADTIKEDKEIGKIQKIKEVFSQVFSEKKELSYKELAEQYALYACESEVTAKRKIKYALENKYLKIYGKKYSINI